MPTSADRYATLRSETSSLYPNAATVDNLRTTVGDAMERNLFIASAVLAFMTVTVIVLSKRDLPRSQTTPELAAKRIAK